MSCFATIFPLFVILGLDPRTAAITIGADGDAHDVFGFGSHRP